MDNRAGEMEVFVQVAEKGSFAAAAKAMRLTPSAVSRTVARIEARLGVRLLQRTTRALALTAEGQAYLGRASAILADIDEVERSLGQANAEPRGRLRVNAAVPYGVHRLMPVLPLFLARYPKVVVDVTLSDNIVDLMEERADVAVRFGPLRDSRLRARSLGRCGLTVVAAPTYLAAHGAPRHPDEMARHNYLHFNFRRLADHRAFSVDGEVRERSFTGNFLAGSGEEVRLMALAGVGIARLANYHIQADLDAGRLVPILEAFNPGDTEEAHAVFVSHEHLSLRVRAFVDFLVEQAGIGGS
jgi:DNA-binding transcriptional LysR family regulator